MDRTDRAIIAILREDARVPNTVLADRVNLTPGPCLRRVQRLEADGIIVGYQARIDPASVGQGFEVMLDIERTQFDKVSIEKFERTVAGFPEVLELHRMFGSPDYLARVAVADLVAYETFLTDRILTIPGMHRVSSRFPMKTLKSLR